MLLFMEVTFSAADEIHASGMGIALGCKDCRRHRKMDELVAMESERVRNEARDQRAAGIVAVMLFVDDLMKGGCQ